MFHVVFRLRICDVGLRHLTVVRLILCLLTVLRYVTNVPVTSLCEFHCYLRLPYYTGILRYLRMFNPSFFSPIPDTITSYSAPQ